MVIKMYVFDAHSLLVVSMVHESWYVKFIKVNNI